jgi:hypothetical protein
MVQNPLGPLSHVKRNCLFCWRDPVILRRERKKTAAGERSPAATNFFCQQNLTFALSTRLSAAPRSYG